jgi:hydrogenase-4 membrane subunit HyfE
MISTVVISAWMALLLIVKTTALQSRVVAEVERSRQLSSIGYIIMGVVFILIVGGLGWCFYRALTATPSKEIQHEEEI